MQGTGSDSGSAGVTPTPHPSQAAATDGDQRSQEQPRELAVRMSGLRRLYELIGRVNGGRSLPDVLQAVVDGVVEGLGFTVAVVNIVHTDGSFEVVAVAGSDDARAELLGHRQPGGRLRCRVRRRRTLGRPALRGARPDPGGRGSPDGYHPSDAGPSVEARTRGTPGTRCSRR